MRVLLLLSSLVVAAMAAPLMEEATAPLKEEATAPLKEEATIHQPEPSPESEVLETAPGNVVAGTAETEMVAPDALEEALPAEEDAVLSETKHTPIIAILVRTDLAEKTPTLETSGPSEVINHVAEESLAEAAAVPVAEETLAVETPVFEEETAVLEEKNAFVEDAPVVLVKTNSLTEETVASVSETPIIPKADVINETPVLAEETVVQEFSTPIEETPAPVEETPVLILETPAPVEETPVEETPAPVEKSTTNIDETPAAVEEETTAAVEGEIATLVEEETAAPVEEETAAPVEEIPAPAEEIPAPAEEIPAPAEEIPAPAEEIPAPVEETIPAIQAEETPVLIQETSVHSVAAPDENQFPGSGAIQPSTSASEVRQLVAARPQFVSLGSPAFHDSSFLAPHNQLQLSLSPTHHFAHTGSLTHNFQQVQAPVAPVDPLTLVPPQFRAFIYPNDAPDVLAAKINFFQHYSSRVPQRRLFG